LIDSKILSEWDIKFFFLDVYSDLSNNKNDIYPKLVEELNSVYESWVRLVLQRQENTNFARIEKTQAEIDLEKQFFLLFSGAELEKLELNYSDKMQDEMYIEIANLYIEFKSPYPSYRTKQILSEWKTVISEYLWVDVEMNVKFEEINLMEI